MNKASPIINIAISITSDFLFFRTVTPGQESCRGLS